MQKGHCLKSQGTGLEAQLCHWLAHNLGASLHLFRSLHLLKNGTQARAQALFLILKELYRALPIKLLLSDVPPGTGSMSPGSDHCLSISPHGRLGNPHRKRSVRTATFRAPRQAGSALNPDNLPCITRWRSCAINNEQREWLRAARN